MLMQVKSPALCWHMRNWGLTKLDLVVFSRIWIFDNGALLVNDVYPIGMASSRSFELQHGVILYIAQRLVWCVFKSTQSQHWRPFPFPSQ